MGKEVYMKDFASFQNTEEGAALMKEAEKLTGNLSGKNENDLIKEIYARAEEGKRNGTLSNAQIDEFFARFSPMLDPPKRKRLQKLVEKLKSI